MERTVGSRAAHATMHQRMASMMGTSAEERMRQLMGRRYADCGVAGGGAGGIMGGGGMAAGAGGAAMMSSSDLGWRRDGNWQHVNRSQWRDVQRSWMGNAMMNDSHHGWSVSVGGVLAVVFGVALLAGLVAFLAVRRTWKPRPPSTPAAV